MFRNVLVVKQLFSASSFGLRAHRSRRIVKTSPSGSLFGAAYADAGAIPGNVTDMVTAVAHASNG